MIRPSLPLLTVLLAAGCAAPRDYPSLLPREAERRSFAEPEATPAAPVAANAALDARIATAQRALGEGAAAFDRAAATAERRAKAAGGAMAGGEAWLDAQVALGDLDSIRSANLSTVTDLEALAAERAGALAPDYPGLEAAIDAGRAAVAAQATRIAELQALLAPV